MATPVGADLSQSFKDGMIEADESSNFIPVDKKDRYGSLVMKPAALEESIPEAVPVHTGVLINTITSSNQTGQSMAE